MFAPPPPPLYIYITVQNVLEVVTDTRGRGIRSPSEFIDEEVIYFLKKHG